MTDTAECVVDDEPGSREGGKVIHLDTCVGAGDRVITGDGQVRSTSQFVEDQRIEEASKDAKDVRRTYLDDMNRDKKERRLLRTRHGNPIKRPIIDQKARYEDTSFVRTLTVEDLKVEKLDQIRQENREKFGNKIDENINELVRTYLEVKDTSVNPLQKTQLLECALLGLTKGPATLDESIQRLDFALSQSTKRLKFTFEDHRKVFKETVRRIVKADPEKTWLRKYLIVDGNGSWATSKYEFPPPMMAIAAKEPVKMKAGWLQRLPAGISKYKEVDLLKELPILREMVTFTDLPHHSQHGRREDDGYGLSKEQRVRKHENESNRRQRLKEIVDYWTKTDDINKAELYLGIMQVSDCIINSPAGWTKLMTKFMSDHPNNNSNFKQVISTDLNGINRMKLFDNDYAINKLLIVFEKTVKFKEIGLIPDAAAIPWRDLCKMLTHEKEGFKILDQYCRSNKHIGAYVDLEKYANPSPTEKTTETLEVKDVIDELEITDVPEKDNPIETIINALMSNVTEEQLGKIVKDAAPGLIELIKRFFGSVKSVGFGE